MTKTTKTKEEISQWLKSLDVNNDEKLSSMEQVQAIKSMIDNYEENILPHKSEQKQSSYYHKKDKTESRRDNICNNILSKTAVNSSLKIANKLSGSVIVQNHDAVEEVVDMFVMDTKIIKQASGVGSIKRLIEDNADSLEKAAEELLPEGIEPISMDDVCSGLSASSKSSSRTL